MKISLITLGCPKNLVESERLLGSVEGQVDIVDPESAEVIILKTCGFIKDACEESFDWIERIRKIRDGKKIIVTGCLVNRFPKILKERFPEVDHFLSLEDEKGIPVLLGLNKRPGLNRLITTAPFAYLMVSDGCDNRCSYCTIPLIRGRYRSFPKENLLAEVRALAGIGVKEIILIGQDTGFYGHDLVGRSLLPDLIDEIASIEGIEWIRLMYLHPAHIDKHLLSVLNSTPKICRYLEIPIQHISDKILKLMRRKVKKSQLTKLFSQLREAGFALRTTVLVGFPGEADSDFQELLQFVEDIGFEYLGIFSFSPEEGTTAYGLPDRIDPEVVLKRTETLRMLSYYLTSRFNRSFLGKRVKVLIDEKGRGRREFDAPEIDSVVEVDSDRIGEFIDVMIDSVDNWQLKGRLCPQS
ncbi:MAG TPA: 30S ribosomal protein S12 methylthiotransferase RimO [bacterium (Candidatus Stahlbacteria)]|nr:30S ribosomal protein S12 methylthiotransferase RimO [Candidatus Stahlbacteria bacterium]